MGRCGGRPDEFPGGSGSHAVERRGGGHGAAFEFRKSGESARGADAERTLVRGITTFATGCYERPHENRNPDFHHRLVSR